MLDYYKHNPIFVEALASVAAFFLAIFLATYLVSLAFRLVRLGRNGSLRTFWAAGNLTWLRPNPGFTLALAVAAGFAILGVSIGLLAGNSREPAMNTVVSSLLALVGAVVAYVIGIRKSENRNAVIGILFFLPVSVIYGAMLGSYSRVLAENAVRVEKRAYDALIREYEAQMKIFEHRLKVREALILKSRAPATSR